MKKHNQLWIFLFLVPTLVLFGAMYIYPIISIGTMSLFEWKQFKPPVFTGLQNFVKLFSEDLRFLKALSNTMIWVVLQSTAHVLIGLFVALALYKKTFLWKIARTSFMIPNVISTAALGTMYLMIFNPQIGAVNMIIRAVTGNEEFFKNWYFDSSSAFYTVTLTWLIYAAVITTLVFAEIMSIPPDLFESSKIDGATGLQADWYITIPLVRNIMATAVIVAATSQLQDFVLIYLTTRGGPGSITLGLPQYLYEVALSQYNYGYSSSISVVLILLGLLIVYTITKMFKYGTSDY